MRIYRSGQPLSQIRRMKREDNTDSGLWSWGPMKQEIVPGQREGYKDIAKTAGTIVQASLMSQLYDFDLIRRPDKHLYMYAKEEDIERVAACPVVLAHGVDPNPSGDEVMLLSPLPIPWHGSYGMIKTEDGKHLIVYPIELLPKEAYQRWETIGKLLQELTKRAGNGTDPNDLIWAVATPMHRAVAKETTYRIAQQEIVSSILNARDDEQRREAEAELEGLNKYHNQVIMVDRLLQLKDYQERFQEIAHMMQDLAADYYAFHRAQIASLDKPQEKARVQTFPLPSLTSLHQTTMPSAEHFRGLAQSFGPRVAQSLWNTEESKEQLLEAPNGARLAVRGENEHEQKALHQLIDGGMGVEGIKYMVVMLAAYHAQTGGVDRKIDARVTLRQLLQFMGREDHADDLDEQRKLMHYILFMARTWVTALDKEQIVKRRGRPRTIHREYTPLIVLEALSADERGGIRIPEAVEFHPGKEFWDQMFGSHKHFFTLPTTLILGYHSKDQAQEICLAFYLANMLNLNVGSFSIHFPTLLLQTGLQDQLDIDKGENRTRAAIRVLFALEQLEKDHLIKRDPHPDIDIALAIAYYAGDTVYTLSGVKMDRLSNTTIERIKTAYRHLSILSPAEMRSKKRVSLQSLLGRVEHNSITFKPGALINTQIEKKKASRQAAIETRERAQEAARKRQVKRNKSG